MAGEQKKPGEQLSFDLGSSPEIGNNGLPDSTKCKTVVKFQDARTIAIRRDAIKRVRASGIFEASTNSSINNAGK